MTGQLHIELLGGMTIRHNGKLVTGFESRKAEALLAYLACRQRPFPRPALAALLWDESTPKQALANLRKLLSQLRKQLADYLLITRRTVAFNTDSNYRLDVEIFREKIATAEPQQLETAMALYQGDFLDGFYLRDGRAFEEWALPERERLRLLAIDALRQLVDYHLHHRQYRAGIVQATRWLALAPLSEAAHRRMMRLQARQGRRNAALRQYARCCRLLEEELQVKPTAATTALYKRIREAAPRPFHFPALLTPFVGRAEELAQISRQLHDPQSRLLTLVGPGGVGKTRLALEAAAHCPPDFRHGVYLVRLDSYETSANRSPLPLLASAIGQALNFTFSSSRAPQAQLIDYLRHKEILLLLDNFEHFLDAGSLLCDIVQQAPQIKLLVTSRLPLALPGEWTLRLQGLSYPSEKNGRASPETYSAIQLFQQQARRVRANFTLSPENRPHVVHICQLVDGLPLGLEMAAVATRTFTPQAIAAKIYQNLDFLNGRAYDLPARHRSLRAVFDYAWQLLTPIAQQTFQKLAVFQGKFSPQAARFVTGNDDRVLHELVEKAALRRENGRYHLHSLLRRYSLQKLQEKTAEYAATKEKHGRYYAQLMQQQTPHLHGPRQKEALQTILHNLDNVRAAWQWATEQAESTFFGHTLQPLYHFYVTNGRYQEGSDYFGQAITALGRTNRQAHAPRLALAQLLTRQAVFAYYLADYHQATHLLAESSIIAECLEDSAEIALIRLHQGMIAFAQSQYERAQQLYRQSLDLFREIGDRYGEATALSEAGNAHSRLGQYREAHCCFQSSLAIRREIGDQRGVAHSLNSLAFIVEHQGNFEEAQRLYQESLALKRELNDRRGVANALNNLGNLACTLSTYEEAKRYYRESLAIKQEIGLQLGVAVTLSNLGTVYSASEEYETAAQLYRQSLAISRQIGDQLGVAFCLINLGGVAQAQQEYQTAYQHYIEGLRTALSIRALSRVLYALTEIVSLRKMMGKTDEREIAWLHFVLNHPACIQEVKESANQILAQITAAIPATFSTKTMTLESIVGEIIEDAECNGVAATAADG